MDNEQTLLKANLPRLRELWSSHQFPADELATLETELDQFSVRLPLIGSFSAGKSSLINFLLGESLLSVAVNPETCLPTELRHADVETIALHRPGKPTMTLDRVALKEQAFGDMTIGNWVEVATPLSVLATLAGMTLVDMPGWESGIEQHANAIDDYLERSAAYCVVVSVDEGGLKDSLKKIIEELAVHKKPMMLVLTKCDKKPPEDVASVLAQVRREIESITGMPLLSISQTSRKESQQWMAALQAIIPRHHDFFHQRVGSQFTRRIETLMTHLGKLLNSENFSIDEINDKQAQMRLNQERLRQDLQQTQQQLQSQVSSIAATICDQFATRLNGQLDALAGYLLRGGDVNGTVGTALRMAYASGVEDRLKPLISSKLSQLERLTEGDFGQINFEHDFQLNTLSGGAFKDVLGNLLPLVMAALTRIPALMILAPVFKGILSALFDNASQEMQRQQEREEARQYVLQNLIPNCLAQVQEPVEQALTKSTKQVMATVEGEIARELNHLRRSLEQLAGQLANEQACDEANKARWQREYHELATLLEQLKMAQLKVAQIKECDREQ